MNENQNVKYQHFCDSIGFRGELTKDRLALALKGKPDNTVVRIYSYDVDGVEENFIESRWRIPRGRQRGTYQFDDLLKRNTQLDIPDAKTVYYKTVKERRHRGEWIVFNTCDNGLTTWDYLYPLTLGLIRWPDKAEAQASTVFNPIAGDVDHQLEASMEILVMHQLQRGTRDLRTHCTCGWKSDEQKLGANVFRTHVASVLAQHVQKQEQEAKAEALFDAATEIRRRSKSYSRNADSLDGPDLIRYNACVAILDGTAYRIERDAIQIRGDL